MSSFEGAQKKLKVALVSGDLFGAAALHKTLTGRTAIESALLRYDGNSESFIYDIFCLIALHLPDNLLLQLAYTCVVFGRMLYDDTFWCRKAWHEYPMLRMRERPPTWVKCSIYPAWRVYFRLTQQCMKQDAIPILIDAMSSATHPFKLTWKGFNCYGIRVKYRLNSDPDVKGERVYGPTEFIYNCIPPYQRHTTLLAELGRLLQKKPRTQSPCARFFLSMWLLKDADPPTCMIRRALKGGQECDSCSTKK
jgi:hypothetical protein